MAPPKAGNYRECTMYVYTTAPGTEFRATAAKAGTDTATKRPVTLTGKGIVRFTLDDTQSAEYMALTDDTARRAFLAKVERHGAMENGKVVISRAALDAFISRVKAAHPATPVLDADGNPTGRVSFANASAAVLASYASGIVALDVVTEDKTESVVAGLFPDEDAPEVLAIAAEIVADTLAKSSK